jgi:tetratricopeptide (TPR) repeat protein
MTRISLCLIAKDEERLLPGCLASVEGAVDEIVLVDTGSSDRTREIARAAGARVYDQLWRGDFSAPRNEAARRATGDWILLLDADERLAPGAAAVLRAAVIGAAWDVGLLPLHNAVRLDARPEDVVSGAARSGTPALLPRLLRNAGGLAWEGVIHEEVDAWLIRRGGKTSHVAADIVHMGQVAELRAARGKRGRNLEMLRKRCQLEPDSTTPFAYLAGELMDMGELDEARRVAEAGWALVESQPPARSIHRLAAMRALLALKAGDTACAIETSSRALARQGDHPDWHYVRGCALELRAVAAGARTAERRERAGEAAAALRAAAATRGVARHEQFVAGADGLPAVVRLGNVLLLAGRPREALGAFEEVLREAPRDTEARIGRAEALLEGGDPRAALAALEALLGERGELADPWLLAAAAASALGSRADAALLLARATERLARGLGALHRRERFAELTTALAVPAARRSIPSTPARERDRTRGALTAGSAHEHVERAPATPISSARTTVICAVWHKDAKRIERLRGHQACLDAQVAPVSRVYVFDGGDAPPDWVKGKVVVSREPLGLYEAWNVALPFVRTPYLMNLNLDDRLNPDAVQLYERALDGGADLVGGDWRICFTQEEADAVESCAPSASVPFHPEWPPVPNRPVRLGSGTGERGTHGPACAWRLALHAQFPHYPWRFGDGSPIQVIGDAVWWSLLKQAGKKLHRLPVIVGRYLSDPPGQAEFRNPAADEHRKLGDHGIKLL